MTSVSTADIERFLGRYSLGGESNPLDVTGSPHFLRVKIPGGIITSRQFRRLAELSETYGRGQAEVTDRQDIQLHWIEAEDALDIFTVLDELGFTTDMCGQGFGGARFGDPRNIVCCPASGIEKGEILNGYPLVVQLTEFFVGNPDYLDLPRKFKISISGCGSDCIMHEINDLAFIAVESENRAGFMVLAGGSIGASLPGPRLAQPVGIFVEPEDAFDVAVATIELHRDYGNRESKSKARFKWLIEHWGLDKYRQMLEAKLGKTFERREGLPFQRHCDHEGVRPQRQKGFEYVHIPTRVGRLTHREMSQVADLAEAYGSGEIRLTTTQNIILPNVRETDALLDNLDKMDFLLHGSKLSWTSIGCASEFCGKTQSPHAKELLLEIIDHLEKHFSKTTLDEAAFRMHVSGCHNNCCAATVAEIGLNGRRTKEGRKLNQSYDIVIGGGLGLEPSFGRLIEKRVPAAKTMHKIGSLMNSYLQHKKPDENLRRFCSRHTNEALRGYLNTFEEKGQDR